LRATQATDKEECATDNIVCAGADTPRANVQCFFRASCCSGRINDRAR
jgi:hypothetical protein